MSGVFVVVEGIDGSGKSTVTNRLAGQLEKLGLDVVTTRQPGGTNIAEAIRNICINTQTFDEVLDTKTEYLLMHAARRQLIKTVIEPALEANKIVISDRHDWSSIAYQQIDNRAIREFASREPDIIIWLNREPLVSHSCIARRGELTKFETIEQLTKAADTYKELADKSNKTIEIITDDFYSNDYLTDLEIAVETIRCKALINKDA